MKEYKNSTEKLSS